MLENALNAGSDFPCKPATVTAPALVAVTSPEIEPLESTNWLDEEEPRKTFEAGIEPPFTFPTVVATDPAEVVTSPVSAGKFPLGRYCDDVMVVFPVNSER